MNKVFLCGRLTKDPDIRTFDGGKMVAKFGLAVSRTYDRETADFFDCECWGKTAELVARYVVKGKQVIVEGELRNDTYERDGVKRTKTVIRADRVEFIGNSQNTAQNQNGGVKQAKDNNIDDLQPIDDDDMPF